MRLAERPPGRWVWSSTKRRIASGGEVEAVVLGIRGVLVRDDAFQLAAIEAAGQCLRGAGIDIGRFRAAARTRLERTGSRSLISRTINDLCQDVGAHRGREASLAAALAVPHVNPRPRLVETLRYLASAVRVAILDRGSIVVLEDVVAQLGLAAISERVLCTEQFGRIGRPPGSIAFRWLAQRLDLPPSEVLYVAGDADMAQACAGAGWRCVRPNESQVGDLEWLVARLERGSSMDATAP